MKRFIYALVLCSLALVGVAVAQEPRFGADVSADPVEFFQSVFGINWQHILSLSAILYILAEVAKKKLPAVFVGGWKTDLFVLLVGMLVSVKMYYPDIITAVISSILCWLVPAGLFQIVGKKFSGTVTNGTK